MLSTSSDDEDLTGQEGRELRKSLGRLALLDKSLEADLHRISVIDGGADIPFEFPAKSHGGGQMVVGHAQVMSDQRNGNIDELRLMTTVVIW